jgi:LPS export ABC transporter protein LptC
MMSNANFYKVFATFLLVTAFAICGYLLLRGKEITMPSLSRPSPGTRLLMGMDGFRITRSENGQVSWRMNATSADLYENKEARLHDIKVVFKGPDNREATMFGDAGTMDTSSGHASLRRVTRDVRIITNDGYLLTTNSLLWEAGERVVRTADPFKLLGSEIYLEGVGISANVDMRTIMVRSNVKAVLQE